MTEPASGSASVVIKCPAEKVWAAIAQVDRFGEWSPETTSARWVAPADGPAVGAKFEGDNEVKAGPITLKKWTTVSEVTSCEPGAVFAFSTEGYTTWRYDFEAAEGGTRVTESFSHPPYSGWQKFVYNLGGSRKKAMVKGMEQTLAGVKASLES